MQKKLHCIFMVVSCVYIHQVCGSYDRFDCQINKKFKTSVDSPISVAEQENKIIKTEPVCVSRIPVAPEDAEVAFYNGLPKKIWRQKVYQSSKLDRAQCLDKMLPKILFPTSEVNELEQLHDFLIIVDSFPTREEQSRLVKILYNQLQSKDKKSYASPAIREAVLDKVSELD